MYLTCNSNLFLICQHLKISSFATSTDDLFQQALNFLNCLGFFFNTGLNYIIEYRTNDNVPFLYECQLCYFKTGLNNMFMHVCGSKHRLAYLVSSFVCLFD